MRPLKLTMQAFGPFSSRVEVLFENLGSNNIYLISGVTGSGKTTIFDAICYALFNTSSGQNRGNANFRSHFAKSDIDSYVEFEFLFNGEKYIILRHPTYLRKKTRGEGFIQENAKAQIILPDGKIIEKVKDVDEFVVELLGIDSAQFSQIALLAQGEFLKLLNADSQTRCDVFRNIFKTWDYADFQNKLKDKLVSCKNQYENLKNSILQYISDVNSETNELRAEKEIILENNSFHDLNNFINALVEQNKNDDKRIIDFKNNISAIEGEIKKTQEEFLKLQNKINLLKQLDDIKANEIKLTQEFEVIKKEYLNIDFKKDQLQKLTLEIKKNEDDYKKILQIKDITNIVNDLKKFISAKEQNIKDEEKKLSDTKNCYVQFLNFKQHNISEQLKEKQDRFLLLQNEFDDLTKKYLKGYNDYLKSQAGILAQDLSDGMPCPVCGSTEHPRLAVVENCELTKEFIDNLKNEVDLKNEKLMEFSKECFLLDEKLKESKNDLDKISKRYNIEVLKEINEVYEIDFEDEINIIENNIAKLKDDLALVVLDFKSNQSKIEILSKDIKNLDIDDFVLRHQKLCDDNVKLEKEIIFIEGKYNDLNVKFAQFSSNADLINEQLKIYNEIDVLKIDLIKIEIEKYKNEIMKLNTELNNILIRKSINEQVLQALVIKNKEFNEISSVFANYKILSDCANGNLKGAIRLPFEQYIQGYYLDMVLNEANKRLKIMTNNQFQFLRKKDITSMQSKTGLDLEVMDFHTFQKRSTKTLSGGESFKAALALALGLSDCVSNLSGAINIDAMFIDEGFGSLDSESLELAMDVISNLSINNRLIGIISHIDELKNRIENQISVQKSDNGSSLTVNF